MRSFRVVSSLMSVMFLLALVSACTPPGVCVSDSDCAAGDRCLIPSGGDEGICHAVIDGDAGTPQPDGGTDAGPDGDGGPDGGPDAGPGPSITQFEPVIDYVAYQGAVHLRWTSTNATSCELSYADVTLPGLDSSESDYTVPDLQLESNQDFTLTCENDEGATDEATTTVHVAVSIESFEADPADLNDDGMVTLSWTARGASSCSIAQTTAAGTTTLPVDTLPEGTTTVSVEEDTTFDLNCENGTSTETAMAEVSVWRVTGFWATPEATYAGGEVTLEWTTSHADPSTCTVQGQTDSDGNPSALEGVVVSDDEVFSLECLGFGDAALTPMAVEVPVLFDGFEPSEPVVDHGASTQLPFNADAGVTCSVDGTPVTSPFTTGALTAVTTYTLECEDAQGRVAQKTATVKVRPGINDFHGELDDSSGQVQVKLLWSVENAASMGCEIESLREGQTTPVPVVTLQDGSGETTLPSTPNGKVTYTLECASDPEGEATSTAELVVWWGPVSGDNVTNDAVRPAVLVTGDVNLLSFSGSDLQGLSTVEEIGGTLLLQNASNLQDLADLGALRRVLGDLTISSNGNLQSVTLPNLTAIGGTLTISSNSSLSTIELPNLAEVGGALTIEKNDETPGTPVEPYKLLGAAFDALTRVDGSFTFSHSRIGSLTTAFPALTSVAGSNFTVTYNSNLACSDAEALYCRLSTRPNPDLPNTLIAANQGGCSATPSCP